jgi:hypothetical protein
MRPNERFSGGNHPRHLCRECARLPVEEREYRQGERDIERLLHGGLHVPGRQRAQFDRFLAHPNARIRRMAWRILAEQERNAEERRRMRGENEASATGPATSSGEADAGASDGGTTTREHDRTEDLGDDVPF